MSRKESERRVLARREIARKREREKKNEKGGEGREYFGMNSLLPNFLSCFFAYRLEVGSNKKTSVLRDIFGRGIFRIIGGYRILIAPTSTDSSADRYAAEIIITIDIM